MAAKSAKVEPGGFTCCVLGCYNYSKTLKGKLSFYVFPKDEKLREQWLTNISRENFAPMSGHRVCSEHFLEGRKTYLNNVLTIFRCKQPRIEKIGKEEVKTVGVAEAEVLGEQVGHEQVGQAQKGIEDEIDERHEPVFQVAQEKESEQVVQVEQADRVLEAVGAEESKRRVAQLEN